MKSFRLIVTYLQIWCIDNTKVIRRAIELFEALDIGYYKIISNHYNYLCSDSGKCFL